MAKTEIVKFSDNLFKEFNKKFIIIRGKHYGISY